MSYTNWLVIKCGDNTYKAEHRMSYNHRPRGDDSVVDWFDYMRQAERRAAELNRKRKKPKRSE